jgi:hypothetical protein
MGVEFEITEKIKQDILKSTYTIMATDSIMLVTKDISNRRYIYDNLPDTQ